jgi:S-disulfanyl-L-cysteine oxidoreductase SoxD
MYKYLSSLFCFCFVCALPSLVSAEGFTNVGRKASLAEIAAWDIDVRADFKGLPKGGGTVSQGQKVWEAKCASCHGVFGESPEVFTPLVGGTTAADVERGRAAGLNAATENARTTIMKLTTVSTLWDYIHRAMPFDAPKSLSVNEVYASTAYLLHLADLVPADFTLSNDTIASVQQRLPNRLGANTAHGMLDVKGTPDVNSKACEKNCVIDEKSLVVLPAAINGRNGNMADQNRPYGSVRGIDTSRYK